MACGRDGQAGRPGCKRICAERRESMLTGKLSQGADGALVHIKAYQTNVGYDYIQNSMLGTKIVVGGKKNMKPKEAT